MKKLILFIVLLIIILISIYFGFLLYIDSVDYQYYENATMRFTSGYCEAYEECLNTCIAKGRIGPPWYMGAKCSNNTCECIPSISDEEG